MQRIEVKTTAKHKKMRFMGTFEVEIDDIRVPINERWAVFGFRAGRASGGSALMLAL